MSALDIWNCNTCNFVNTLSTFSCSSCGSDRAGGAAAAPRRDRFPAEEDVPRFDEAAPRRHARFHAEDARKMGRECREGLGRPTFEKGLPAAQYFQNAHIRNALGCRGYVKYDFETKQYCCSETPATAGELIEFLLMIMKTMSNSLLNTKIYDPGHRDYVVQMFNFYINRVPAHMRQTYITRYDAFLQEIDRNRRSSVMLEHRVDQDEEQTNWELTQIKEAKRAIADTPLQKATMIAEANTRYDTLPPFGPINYGFGKSKKSVRKNKKSVRKSPKKRKSVRKTKKSVRK